MDMYDEPNSNSVAGGGPGAPPLTESWRRCCDRLRAELGDDIFNSWFGRIALESVSSGQARLSVPTRFLKSWIDTHYAGHIGAALSVEVGPMARINVFVRSSMRLEPPAAPAPSAPAAPAKPPAGASRELDRSTPSVRRATTRTFASPSVGRALAGSPPHRRPPFSTFHVAPSQQL